MEGFQAAESYGSAIVAVPDPESLYRAFAARLRETFGKLPIAGIPRIMRPRKKFGTVYGFNVIDPGGNWLRFYRLGDTEADAEAEHGLAGIIDVAARLGDAHGDELIALKTLENGLTRFADAAAIDRARAYLYRAELAVRIHNRELARSSLNAAQSLGLTDAERAAVAEEFAHVAGLVQQEQEASG
jgi:hypothetical protein